MTGSALRIRLLSSSTAPDSHQLAWRLPPLRGTRGNASIEPSRWSVNRRLLPYHLGEIVLRIVRRRELRRRVWHTQVVNREAWRVVAFVIMIELDLAAWVFGKAGTRHGKIDAGVQRARGDENFSVLAERIDPVEAH